MLTLGLFDAHSLVTGAQPPDFIVIMENLTKRCGRRAGAGGLVEGKKCKAKATQCALRGYF